MLFFFFPLIMSRAKSLEDTLKKLNSTKVPGWEDKPELAASGKPSNL